MGLEIRTEDLAPGHKVVRAAGEIGHHVLDQFEKSMQEAIKGHPQALLVDLSQVSFFSSGAGGVLLASNTILSEQGGKLVIVGAKGRVAESLAIIGLLSLLLNAATEGEALKLVDGGRERETSAEA